VGEGGGASGGWRIREGSSAGWRKRGEENVEEREGTQNRKDNNEEDGCAPRCLSSSSSSGCWSAALANRRFAPVFCCSVFL
jgi:hypothetical protein